MLYRLTIVCLLLFSINRVDAQDVADSLMTESIDEVQISSQRALSANTTKLSRKQFLTMAGALEDPSRLLIKSPGISTANDQANSVIYHGMPSHAHQWTLFGAKILNPNHLANAGTITDLPSSSAGGVNMLSGQVIGQLEFFGNPSEKGLTSLGAVSDLSLRKPFKNGISTNLSLIGLEVGVDRVSSDDSQSLMANARYSTVGLLTGLGLDFGGEIITYQDLSLMYGYKLGENEKLTFYTIIGSNSNSKQPIEDLTLAQEYKDVLKINSNNNKLILGANYHIKTNEYTWNNTINFSRNKIDRTSLDPSNALTTQFDYGMDLRLLSLSDNFDYQWKDNLTIGFSLNPEFHIYSTSIAAPDGEFSTVRNIDRAVSIATPRVRINYSANKNLSFNLAQGYYLSSIDFYGLPLIGSLSSTYKKDKFYSKFSISRNAQLTTPEYIGNVGFDFTKSTNLLIELGYDNITLSGFIHNIDNVKSTTYPGYFTALENGDYLPSFNGFLLFSNPQGKGSANISGLSLALSKTIFDWKFSSNVTLTNSSHNIDEVTQVTLPNEFGHVFNLSLSKEWQLSKEKTIGFATSFHHRGGQNQRLVDVNNSFDWGYTEYIADDPYSLQLADYYRADLRIYYKPSKRSTVSLDIQNVTSRLNDAHYYYEPLTGESTLRQQLGLIPILSWRVDW